MKTGGRKVGEDYSHLGGKRQQAQKSIEEGSEKEKGLGRGE